MKNELILDADIYEKEAVIQAIKAFESIAQIKLSTDNKEHCCIFENTKYDLGTTEKEFENYIIDWSNQQRMF